MSEYDEAEIDGFLARSKEADRALAAVKADMAEAIEKLKATIAGSDLSDRTRGAEPRP